MACRDKGTKGPKTVADEKMRAADEAIYEADEKVKAADEKIKAAANEKIKAAADANAVAVADQKAKAAAEEKAKAVDKKAKAVEERAKESRKLFSRLGGLFSRRQDGQATAKLGDHSQAFARQVRRDTMLVVGSFLVAFVVLGVSLGSNTGQDFAVFAASALIAAAAASVGAIVGFIFAIPRALQSSDIQPDHKYTRYLENTNLEQISDWLTKILVGISLVQISSLRPALAALGRNLAPMLGGRAASAGIGVAICVTAALSAFLLAYLWTRVAVSWTFALTGRDLGDALEEIKEDNARKENSDAEALAALHQHLAGRVEQTVESLAAVFKKASKPILEQIYSQTEYERRRTWLGGPLQAAHNRVIPVFRALIESDTGHPNHEYYGSLGFALKNQEGPDYKGAIDKLTEAIKLRGPNNGWVIYEYVRAICRITRPGSEGQEVQSIRDDLRAAKLLGPKYFEGVKNPSDRRQEDREAIAQWLEDNELTYETL